MNNIKMKSIDWFDDRFYKVCYENIAKLNIIDYFASVTTKIGALAKHWLPMWYGDLGTREAQQRMTEAADRGSRIHWAWYTLTTGGVVIYDPPKTPIYTVEEKLNLIKRYNNAYYEIKNQDEMWQVMKLHELLKRLNPLDVMSEMKVYDIENRDAGTADNLFKIKAGSYEVNGSKPLVLKEGAYIHDLKTGKVVNDTSKMQVAAYGKMASKMTGVEIIGGLISHTHSKNKSGIEGLSVIHITKEEMESYYQDYRDIARVWERNFGNLKPTIRDIPGMIAW